MPYFKAKIRQIQFRLGLCPRPRWESLQRSPIPLSWSKRRPTSNGGKGVRGGERREMEGKPQPNICLGDPEFVATPLYAAQLYTMFTVAATRLPVDSSRSRLVTGQLVTRSTRHAVDSSQRSGQLGQLVTSKHQSRTANNVLVPQLLGRSFQKAKKIHSK